MYTTLDVRTPLLTEREAAEYLNCSVSTLRRYRLAGIGPTYLRHGRLIRYYRHDLDAFINECRVPRSKP